MRITVIGLGYVGLANALLLADDNEVVGVDLDTKRIKQLQNSESPLKDAEIEEKLANSSITWTTNLNSVKVSELVIISTPTNFNDVTKEFDTTSIKEVIKKSLQINPGIYILIKSTIPVGYVLKLRKEMKTNNIAFSPEFLREGRALYDNLYPSRIIIGDTSDYAMRVASLFKQAALNTPEILAVEPEEAESIKLFSNTYLAMRVAFFNELDNYAMDKNLNSKAIITGLSLDPRIGDHYNNPSFGYGGYCLPKDTKQLEASYGNTPQNLISSIISSNDTRKHFITQDILKLQPKKVGIYRLAMKSGSDNFRMSAVLDLMDQLTNAGIKVVIYEPMVAHSTYSKYDIVDFATLKTVDLIVANRIDAKLAKVQSKIYTRDMFWRD